MTEQFHIHNTRPSKNWILGIAACLSAPLKHSQFLNVRWVLDAKLNFLYPHRHLKIMANFFFKQIYIALQYNYYYERVSFKGRPSQQEIQATAQEEGDKESVGKYCGRLFWTQNNLPQYFLQKSSSWICPDDWLNLMVKLQCKSRIALRMLKPTIIYFVCFVTMRDQLLV